MDSSQRFIEHIKKRFVKTANFGFGLEIVKTDQIQILMETYIGVIAICLN